MKTGVVLLTAALLAAVVTGPAYGKSSSQFAVDLGLGVLNNSAVAELKFAPSPEVGFFLGGEIVKKGSYWRETEEYQVVWSYIGDEYYFTPSCYTQLKKSELKLKFPVGFLYLLETKEMRAFVGLRLENSINGYGLFCQLRAGLLLVTLIGGLTF